VSAYLHRSDCLKNRQIDSKRIYRALERFGAEVIPKYQASQNNRAKPL